MNQECTESWLLQLVECMFYHVMLLAIKLSYFLVFGNGLYILIAVYWLFMISNVLPDCPFITFNGPLLKHELQLKV
jgi:hypothetical protein